MKCKQCDRDYPSRYYFMTDSHCRECFEKLSEQERDSLLVEVESLSTEGPAKRTVAGRDLSCPVCGHDRFQRRKTLLNTPGLTFLGVEWANKQADNFICDSCGHLMWFLLEP